MTTDDNPLKRYTELLQIHPGWGRGGGDDPSGGDGGVDPSEMPMVPRWLRDDSVMTP